jgi:amidohydrolase
MDQYLLEANQMAAELKDWRHYLHQNPELGLDLPVTTVFVKEKLISFGLEPQEISPSALTCLIEGKTSGKTFLLRADMDALPMPETTALPFKSTKENMAHTCGHDLHATMLLGAAKLLQDNRSHFKGTVKLMFQPGEETLEGAKAMIAAGIMESPHVDAAMAMHMMLDGPVGGIGYGHDYMSSSSDNFTIAIKGRGCHGAMPHTGIDPLNAAVHIYQSLQSLIARENPTDAVTALSVCQLTAGGSFNIIPDTAFMRGTLRTYDPKVRRHMKQRIADITRLTAQMFQAEADFTWASAAPSIKSDSQLVQELVRYIDDMDYDFYKIPDYRIPPSEDFSYVSELVPATFLLLCAKVEDNDFPHHNPNVVFDEDALPLGAAIYAQCATQWLNNN